MTKESLIAERDALQPLFDAETQKIKDAEAEQFRLQGEYRRLNKLIEELETKETKPKEKVKNG